VTTLGDHTWPEVAGMRALLLVPLGSCEQHGPHLPLDTDTRIAVAIAERAAQRLTTSSRGEGARGLTGAGRAGPAVVVAPPLAYGASGEHAAFPGTLSIGLVALEHVLVELVRSADHFDGVLLVSAHGGNTVAVDAAVDRLSSEGRRVLAWSAAMPGDAHAGRTETSALLAVAPEVVRLEAREAGCTSPLAVILPVLQTDGVVAVSTNGVLGDPAGASVEEGEALLEAAVDDLIGAIVAQARAAG
jgi:creatinine amidohydrolase